MKSSSCAPPPTLPSFPIDASTDLFLWLLFSSISDLNRLRKRTKGSQSNFNLTFYPMVLPDSVHQNLNSISPTSLLINHSGLSSSSLMFPPLHPHAWLPYNLFLLLLIFSFFCLFFLLKKLCCLFTSINIPRSIDLYISSFVCSLSFVIY